MGRILTKTEIDRRPAARLGPLPPAKHPELDHADGDLSWERWLEGMQRLETALLIAPR